MRTPIYSVVDAAMTIELEHDRLPLRQTDGGVIRLEGSRVTLDTIVHAYLSGRTAEEIAEGYPSVPLAHVYSAIAFYLAHRLAVDAYLAARDAQATEVRREVEARWPSAGIRERLLARRRDAGR